MKLVLKDDILAPSPPVVELSKVGCSTYHNGDYGSVTLIGITPAQLHDAIGCPQADEYAKLEAAVRAWLVDFDNRYDGEGLPNLREIEALQAAIAALDAARKVADRV